MPRVFQPALSSRPVPFRRVGRPARQGGGHAHPARVHGLFGRRGLGAVRGRRRPGVRGGEGADLISAAERSARCRARRSPRRSRSRAERCSRSATRAKLSGLKTGDTKIVDLAGRTLFPGLIDPHNHTILASLIFELLDDVGYAKYPTREKLVAHLKQEAASAPKGQWIVGSNFDNLLQGGDLTLRRARRDLDRPSDLRLVHQRPRRLRQQRGAENRGNSRGHRRTAGRRPFRPGPRRQARRPGLRGKRDAQVRGPLPRQDHARGRGQGGHGLRPACRVRRQHPAARARHDPLGLDRAVRQAFEHARLPHERERDVRRHEGPRALPQPRPRARARRSTAPCSRSTASRSSATAPTRPRPGRRRSPI